MMEHVLSLVFLAQQDDARRLMEESIAKQKESIQKQIGTTGFFTPGWFTPAGPVSASADCPALPESETGPMITAAATKHQVDAALLRAMIRQESGSKPCAVSPKGAMGLMQLMPATAKQLAVEDPFDAVQNLNGGARYIKQMLERFKGDVSLALAGYNAGPERVEGKVPEIAETKDYVARILKALETEKKTR